MAEQKNSDTTEKETPHAKLRSDIEKVLNGITIGRYGAERKLAWSFAEGTRNTVVIFRTVGEANEAIGILGENGFSAEEIRLHEYAIKRK